MNQVDLHTHTTASDGALTPTQLIHRAARRGLTTLAVTDHDTTAGLAEARAAAAPLGITLIPGVEINTDMPGAEVHILGYFIDGEHPELVSQLAHIRAGRIRRAQTMAAALTQMGAPVRFERILEIAGEGAVGRPHVAQALVEAGHVRSFGEAFERYIGRNSPAYVERQKFTPAEACALIALAGGLPVLAHPIFFGAGGRIQAATALETLLPGLLDAGLRGIEVYYTGYDAITIEYLLGHARRYGLLPTGGTDFHGIRPGEGDLGSVYVPNKVVRNLRAAWESDG
jgi:predicted metal-dependent phosphoesterase TrpH